jgi:ribosome-binding factor A
MPGYRKERLEKQIRMIVADALIKDIKDPRIGFVTVTNVKLNKDKSIAYVYISIMGDDKAKKKSMLGLKSASGFLQYKIGKEIKMRNTPKILIQSDSSIETGLDMAHTLDMLEKHRIEESHGDEADDTEEIEK